MTATGGGTISDSITLTATVTKAGTGATPTGSVTFSEGSTVLEANVPLNGGVASHTISNPTAGKHTYTAAYSGQSDYYNGSSVTRTINTGLSDQTGFAITAPGVKTYGDSDFTLMTSGGQSMGGVSFSVPSGNGVLTVTADGTVKITGEGVFSPDRPVTRKQMAVMMVNYAGQIGCSIPAPLAEAAFTDNASISAWAAEEVKAMQRAGIIRGKDAGRFAPQDSATRAEVSAVLHRFVEIVIDPTTAQGWTKNDSDHWLYYKNGQKFTGWQKIGSKWYYFYPNGVMAVNTTIDGYTIGSEGARTEN